MKFGAHVSAAGSLANAPKNAAALGLETFQFFSRPPQGGKVNPITDEQAAEFKATCAEFGFTDYYIHAPYIINLASKEERIRNNSIDIIKLELERANQLGVRAVMFHPGSASSVGSEDAGEKLVIDGIKKILKGYKGNTLLLIEVSAGAGMIVGAKFEQIGRIIKAVNHAKLACCLDTAHMFASGYDIRTSEAVKNTLADFDKHVGLDKLIMSHLNDSKVDIGERKDRHEHIGDGFIGKKGFEALFAYPAIQKIDLVLETEHDKIEDDINLIKKIRETS